MSERVAVALAKACLLLNHGPTVLVSSAPADKQRRSVHYQAGGSFFATGDAFEV